jgi:hypothetical protein
LPQERDVLVSPELFDDVVEYIKTLQRKTLGDESEGDFLTEDHPLVAFCQDLLEQLSAQLLSQRIVGFGPQSRRRLALERRRLERRRAPESLQKVVFELATVASTLGTATYIRTEEVTEEFRSTEFVALLDSVVRYLNEVRPNAADTESAENAQSELRHLLGVEEGEE